MATYFIGGCLNMAIALAIPFRQYKNGLFLLFLLSGIVDPVNLALRHLFSIDLNIALYINSIIIYVITIYYVKKEKIGRFYIVSTLMLVFAIPLLQFNILFDSETQNGVQIIIGLSTVVYLLSTYNLLVFAIRNIFSSGKINLYYFTLVFINVITVLKLGVIAMKLEVGIAYFVISFFLEGIINIYFIFFDIKNSPQISLGGKKAKAEVIES